MDSHQGAGFAFDMNMDFSNVFATTKQNEGETSNSFFGDEGIDTSNFGQFDPMNSLLSPQMAFGLDSSLTLDNTSGSTSVWDGQLTPQLQNVANTFPHTPAQSFDSLYQPTQYGTALGKRPLQLDVQDFPRAKRHESIGDFTLFPPMPSAATSWAIDAHPTPATSVEMGISDEAADMCAMWFNKYNILPSDKHIDSLSQLTGESSDAIRHWFGNLMKQGMGNTTNGDSAYKSQTALQPDQFWNSFHVPHMPLEESTQESITTPENLQETVTVSPSVSANALRGGKKSRCAPTEDQSLLARDSNKVYQCTRKCGKRYGRKCDWKRNEEEGYPCKSWVCSLCVGEGVDNVKPCFRKYHFAQHFRNIHPGVNCDDFEEASVVCSETEFPRKCGFCKHRFESRQERIDHIADHFKQGKCMLDWNDSDDSDNSDNTNDDDDDKPSDDDSDGSRPAYQPPQRDPRGGLDPKYYDGGSDRSGNSGGAQGGFFQFQLSQLNEGQSGPRSSRADQLIKPTNALPETRQRTRCASEPLPQQSIEQPSSAGQWYTRGNFDAPKRDDSHPLARDGLTRSLVQREGPFVEDEQYLKEHLHPTEVEKPEGEVDWLDALLTSRQRMTIKQAKTASTAVDATDHRTDSGARLDQTALTRIDDKDGSQATGLSNPAPAGQKGIQTSRLPSLESKILQTIPTTSQSFLSVRFLGSGGFSTVDEVVHRATNLRLGRKTLKNRDPAALKELWKEVNVLQKLRHPHVIRFLGAYSKGDKMSILLSPIADTTLALWLDRFKQDKPANFSQVVTKMFGCLASSVRYLHEQRPVVKHMDIKPQNILIVEGDGEFPHVVLCDFGISSSEDLTDGRIQPLTRQYVAPETFEGFTRKEAADIWSLGCVFAEMASVSFSQSNPNWQELRKEFSGRATKYYWQDVPGLQDRLATLLEGAATLTERTVVRTLKSMLSAQPDERPDAASLTMVFAPAPCCLSWPNDNAAYPGPREELSSVEMLAHEDGIDCHAQLHQHGQSNTRTDHGLSSAKGWIKQCSHHHEACSHSPSSHTKALPTRLIDICPNGKPGSSVCVVDTASIDSSTGLVEYVALSHVWSRSDTTLSTDHLQNLSTHVDVPLSSLSQAMNAAVNAARGLEYRYIWIDSLCVLQNSDDDKQKECASMASTFRNAALTLILDNIDGGTTDFNEFFADTNGTDQNHASSGFAWDTRAWALQERLLSHRLLHLGQEQMYWECNSLKASETFPQGLPSLLWEKAHTKPDATHHPKHACTSPGIPESKQASKLDHLVRTPAKSKQANRPEQRRIRDCQWIKKQGDGRSHCTSDDVDVVLPPQTRYADDKHRSGVFHGEHHVAACDAVKSKNLTDDRGSAPLSSSHISSSSLVSLSSTSTTGLRSDAARTQIRTSGQLDQNGNLSRSSGNANGRTNLGDGGGGKSGDVNDVMEE
ncbi:hypothetical protein CC86DRAFT_471467 [Ophiobolus disseminans]|uniref:Protein kinase domain-containing protein n=1 Tax=Ophiobolus disseminans TaxID=1469910 RepID=A0A6A6ZGZ0_9PLEO|nr:hypothetical protein CC86DRAFT_471467 [Ophiobolus disseminans]